METIWGKNWTDDVYDVMSLLSRNTSFLASTDQVCLGGEITLKTDDYVKVFKQCLVLQNFLDLKEGKAQKFSRYSYACIHLYVVDERLKVTGYIWNRPLNDNGSYVPKLSDFALATGVRREQEEGKDYC